MLKSSPFEVVHERLEANFGEYNGWRLPSDYGDSAAESRALQEKSAAFDLSSFGRIKVQGPKAELLIDKLLAEDAERPADGKWVWETVCEKHDHTGDVIRIGKVNGSYIIFTLPGKCEKILELTEACAAENKLSEVQITDITEKTGMLGIYGPEAVRAIANIVPFDVAGIGQSGIINFSFFMMSLTIIRGSWIGSDGLELMCPASVGPMAAGAVAKYHKRENITPGGMDCLKTFMAEASESLLLAD